MTHYHVLLERIANEYAGLTKNSRRIADFLQSSPERLLMLSTAEIAESCGVSKTSVSRFIRQIGYQDHTELRHQLLAEREQGTPVVTGDGVESDIQFDISELQQLQNYLASVDLSVLIETLAQARRIKVIGYRNSYPLALHLRQQLLQCRPNVDLLPTPGQTLGEELASLDEQDFVILVGIRRRPKSFKNLVAYLQAKPCLLITDQSGLKYSNQVAHLLSCHLNNETPLDSHAAPMSLIAYLVNRLYLHLGSAAVQQSSAVSQSYAQLEELDEHII
ncbi:MurR/RpiR family transcriptional regulator [Reinekea thalattae]|nr:MurR/RpiR family transcriptional regulator [Reinekea thalattae]